MSKTADVVFVRRGRQVELMVVSETARG